MPLGENVYICYTDRELTCTLTGKKINSGEPYLVIQSSDEINKIQVALVEINTLIDDIKTAEEEQHTHIGATVERINKGKNNNEKCIVCNGVSTKKPIISFGPFIDPWIHLSCVDECIESLENIAEENSEKIVVNKI